MTDFNYDEFVAKHPHFAAFAATRSPGTWDSAYRCLDKDEIILATDEVQHEDGSWGSPRHTVGGLAPDPNYTSHRVYRRKIENA